MKYLFVLLVLLPIVFCAPQERFLLDTFGLDKVVQQVEQFAHSGMAQGACETECQNLVHGFVATFCGTACTTIKEVRCQFVSRCFQSNRTTPTTQPATASTSADMS